MTICDSEAPSCDTDNRLVMGYSALSCCPEYRCGEKIKSTAPRTSDALRVSLHILDSERFAAPAPLQSVIPQRALLCQCSAAGRISSLWRCEEKSPVATLICAVRTQPVRRLDTLTQGFFFTFTPSYIAHLGIKFMSKVFDTI